jgi:hypothetical protein
MITINNHAGIDERVVFNICEQAMSFINISKVGGRDTLSFKHENEYYEVSINKNAKGNISIRFDLK